MQCSALETNMTQVPVVIDPTISDIAQELDDIGEEFGCARDPSETNEEYGVRIATYLDEMIEELRLTQDKVNELIS
jgi:hypothetical protein